MNRLRAPKTLIFWSYVESMFTRQQVTTVFQFQVSGSENVFRTDMLALPIVPDPTQTLNSSKCFVTMPDVIHATPEGCEHFDDVSDVSVDIVKFVPNSIPMQAASTNEIIDIGNSDILSSPNMTRTSG